jgi:hypothetical protein
LLDRRAQARATLPAPLADAIRREVDSIAWANEIGAHLARDIGVRR